MAAFAVETSPCAIVNGCLCVVLGVFALVQYNDPDALVWFLIYAIPATWAGIAAFRPQLLVSKPRGRPEPMPPASAAAIAGSLWWWPSLPAGWIHIETEREGLGILTVTLALALVGLAWWQRTRHWQPLQP